MRAHIGQLIAAHEELGSEPDEAVTASLTQFGPPDVVAARWLDQLPVGHMASNHRRSFSFRYGPLRAALKGLAASVSVWVTIGVLQDSNISGPVLASFYIALGASLPCVTGYLIGRRYAAERPELAMLAAQAAVIPLWPVLMMWLMSAVYHMHPDMTTAATLGAVSFLTVAPIGCLGTWIGKIHTRRDARRRAIA
jgi:hypothetical protein